MIQFAILHSSMMYICVILVNYVNFTGIKASILCEFTNAVHLNGPAQEADQPALNPATSTKGRASVLAKHWCFSWVLNLINQIPLLLLRTNKCRDATSIQVLHNTIYIQQIVHVIWDQVDKIHTCKISTADTLSRQTKFFSYFHASLPNSRNIIVILLLLILSLLPKQPLFSVPPGPWCDCIQFQIAASIPSCWRPRSCHPIEQPGAVWCSSFAEEMWAAQQGPAKKEKETSHFPKFRNSLRSNQPT